MKADPRGFYCAECGKNSTTFARNNFLWYRNEQGNRICTACYGRMRYRKSRIGKIDKRKFKTKTIPDNRFCINCGDSSSYQRKWYRIENGFLCHKCHTNLVWNKKINGYYVWFKNKLIHLDYCPRTQYCILCDAFCDLTSLHHYFYDDSDPLACTIELCNHHHQNIHYFPVIDLEDEIN
jgi:hypothetical protein